MKDRISALVGYEEQRLARELNAQDQDTFWASRKNGGPVHWWTLDYREPPGQDSALPGFRITGMVSAMCTGGLKWVIRHYAVGKERDPAKAKRVCKECRARFVATLGL